MTPQFKFTFYNATLSPGGTEVAQPVGWKDSFISLVRDPKYHSLVEFFKGSFIWYGSARTFIKTVEALEGADAKIRLVIGVRYSETTETYDTLFDGKLDVSQIEDVSMRKKFYKSVVPIIQDDHWTKFINRVGTSVDLEAAVDLDGAARTAVNKIVLPLPSQPMRKELSLSTTAFVGMTNLSASVASGLIHVLGLGFENELRTELKETFTLSSSLLQVPNDYGITGASAFGEDKYVLDNKLYQLKVKEYVDGTFNLVAAYRIDISRDPAGGGTHSVGARFGIAVRHPNNDVDFYEASNSYFTSGRILTDANGDAQAFKTHELHQVLSLVPGDEVYCYGELCIISGFAAIHNIGIDYAGNGETFISFSGETTTTDSETDAYLIKDAAESILSKVTGQNSAVLSDTLDSCKGLNAVARGKHIRGYTFAQKAMAMSFDDWWSCYEPLLNLGLGYEEVAGVKKIRIEDKSYFYNPVPTIFLSHVTDLVRTYDLKRYWNLIEIGFEKWSAESGSGIDDPQTKRFYSTQLRTVGSKLPILSKTVAASLAIEQTRRERVEVGKDWKLDEDLLTIAVKEDGPDYTPELGSDFDSVTNLLHSDGRYNIRHTPGRMLLRWREFLAGCLLTPAGSDFKFQRGEGNYEMESTLDAGQCEEPEDSLGESDDVPVGTESTFIPETYRAKIAMTWETYKAIRAVREEAIGVSASDENYLPMFIVDMNYYIPKGYANFIFLLANKTPINP